MTDFDPAERLRSFGPALRGIGRMLHSEHNAWIHAVATVAVIAAGGWVGITSGEWLAVALAIALVWVAEAMNTAIEALGDAISLERNPLIRQAKDIGAGAVLLAAIAALVVAAIVFVPRLLVGAG
jgi:diacylglycerol kinase